MKLDLAVIGGGAVGPAGVGLEALDRNPAATEVPLLGRPEKRTPVFKVSLQDPAFARWQREPRLRRASPISYFLVEAAEQALAQAGLSAEERKRTGLAVAFSTGSLVYSRRFFEAILAQGRKGASPALFPETVFNSPVSHVAATLGLGGAAYALVGDETAWIAALKTAWLWLERGEADRVLVLGAEEFDPVILDAAAAAGWLRDGGGFVPSEGAGGVLVRKAAPGDRRIVAAGEEGFPYRSRRGRAAAARAALASFPAGTRWQGTAERNTMSAAEAQARARLGPSLPPLPYLGEAGNASSAWHTLRALDRMGDGPLLLPIWGLTQQVGWLDLAPKKES